MPSESHTGDQEAQGATCPRRAGCLRWCRPGRRGAAYAARRRTAGPGRPGDRRAGADRPAGPPTARAGGHRRAGRSWYRHRQADRGGQRRPASGPPVRGRPAPAQPGLPAGRRVVHASDLSGLGGPTPGSLVVLGAEAGPVDIAKMLVAAGWADTTPIALTWNGTTSDQHTVVSRLGSVAADLKAAGV